MPNLVRITIALDEETEKLLEKMAKETGISYSSLVRTALKFYSQNKDSAGNDESMKLWSNLLSKGEHIILDIDHWLLLLKYIESSVKKEAFYAEGKNVAKSHAGQLAKVTVTPEEYLKRLEACNFFKLNKDSDGEYTLILSSNLSKRFVKELISETLTEMGHKIDVKEDIAKLRVRVLK